RWVYAVGNAKKRRNASRDPNLNVVMGTFFLNNRYASILFDTGADRSFISSAFSSLIDIVPTPLGNSYEVELADGKIVRVDTIMWGCTLNFLSHPFNIDLMPVELGCFDVIIGMDWLRRCHAVIVCDEKLVRIPYGNETLTFHSNESNNGRESRLTVISCSKAQEYMTKGFIRDYPKVFPKDLSGLSLTRPVEFQIDLIPGAAPVAGAPYRLAPFEMKELSEQLQELSKKGFIRPSSSPWGALCLVENRLEIRLSPAESARIRRSKNSIQNTVWTLRVSSHAIRTDKRTCGIHGSHEPETTEKIVLIKQRIQAAQDRQKSYIDLKRKPMEFKLGDRVMLKVSPWKGVVRFGGCIQTSRRIEAIDADKDITLVDMETKVDLGAKLQGRVEEKDEVNVATKEVNVVEPIVFDDEEPDRDEEPKKKRVAKETLLQESFKKLRAEVKVSGSKSTQDIPTDDPKEMSEEDVQNMLQIITVTEFKVEALQVKYPIIDWEIHSEGSRSYWKLARVDEIIEAYQSFEDMLKVFDREGLDALWRMVKERFSTSVPIVDKEKAL
nr:putative reverse transcriptase domain-containing protein [Tanacetum cinerariifolium]